MTHPTPSPLPNPDTELHPSAAGASSGSDVPTELGGRYDVHGEIARGGMGVVYRARDRILQRDLAIKVLLPAFADQPEIARRFLEEAQVAAQLQHPAIVPIHEMGTLPDGRPFFTMKLVKGRTLAELLAERPSPRDDRPRLLAIFEQVCQAVAYAHSKGVIHRDLKPANVMVGAFGEVQVMDWGLAKVLGASGDHAAGHGPATLTAVSVVEPPRAAPGSFDTQTGSALGTFAYMPPEQARGEVDRLDRRCDVFGLGAVLCEILTGAPVYTEGTLEELRSRAVLGQVGPAQERLTACGADPELTELAQSCLAANPDDRPADAGSVAAALFGYREGVQERLRQAEVGRAEAQVKAIEERKRRRLTLLLAAAVGLFLAAVGGAGWWYQHDRDAHAADQAARQAQTELQVTAALREAETLTDEGWRQTEGPERWRMTVDLAQSAVQRAEELLPAAPGLAERVAAVRSAVDEAARDSRLVTDVERIHLKLANSARGAKRNVLLDELADAFRAYGVDPAAPEAAAERVRNCRVREALLAALEWWARQTPDPAQADRINALLSAVEPDPNSFGSRWRTAWQRMDRATLVQMAEEPAVRDLPPLALVNLADDLSELKELVTAERLLRDGHERRPNDFWLNVELATVLRRQKPTRPEEAARFLTAALALRPRSPVVWNNLSVVLTNVGRNTEAERCVRRALDLDSDYAVGHANLGGLLRDRNDLDSAERHCRRALELEPDLLIAHMNLAVILGDKNDPEGALRHLRRANELSPNDFTTLYNLGVLLRERGELDEALRAFQRGAAVAPNDAATRVGVGQVLLLKGQYDEAKPYLQRALELLPPTHPLRTVAAELLRDSDEMPGLARKLPAILKGDAKPAGAAEALGLARLCQTYRKLYAAAARFYDDAFAADPKLLDPATGHRYNAACAAALAGCGHGDDAASLDAPQRARLRRQALDWLRADLAFRKTQSAAADPADRAAATRALRHWQQDSDLAGVRDRERIEQLPEAERPDWRRLWDDVAALLK
jgi:serine/threonine-protein kinase